MAEEIIIDTNRYRDFCAAEAHTVDVFRRVHAIHVPIMVVAELRAGFVMDSRSASNESVLARFLSRTRVRALRPDMATIHHYADLFRQLRVGGTPIPVNDLWIAALGAQHELSLFTRDSHFDYLPQLPRIDWPAAHVTGSYAARQGSVRRAVRRRTSRASSRAW